MLPPTQRRNASVRGGHWRADTGAVHEAVQLGRRSCGANRRGNEGLFKNGGPGRMTSSRPARLPNSPSNGEVEGPDDVSGRTQVERSSSVVLEAAGRAPIRSRITDPSNVC